MGAIANRRRELYAQELAAGTPMLTAYVVAGFADTKWSRFNASKLANDPEVKARVLELQEQFAERAGLQAQYIQAQILPLVQVNAKDLIEPAGDGREGDRLKPISKMSRNAAAAIQRIRADAKTGEIVGFDLYSKNEAASVLLRSIGGLLDRVKVEDDRDSEISDAECHWRLVAYVPQILSYVGVPTKLVEELVGCLVSLANEAGFDLPAEWRLWPEWRARGARRREGYADPRQIADSTAPVAGLAR